jgi:hypothetical protein
VGLDQAIQLGLGNPLFERNRSLQHNIGESVVLVSNVSLGEVGGRPWDRGTRGDDISGTEAFPEEHLNTYRE